MDELPLYSQSVARRSGSALVRLGPVLSQQEASEIVASIRAAALASVRPVADVTGLEPPPDAGAMLVVDRPTWVAANVEMASAMITDAVGPARTPEGLRQRAESLSNSLQIGAALALLAPRVLGQFVPFGVPRLLLVAPNVVAVERELGVDPADFRLWVCLHEQTHRLQFARAPWLRQHLARQFGTLLEASDDGGRNPGLPTSIIDLVTTPAQRVVFDRITAVMSLLEGYADVMMDRVGPDVVPTVGLIRQRFEARRARAGWTRVLNKAMGMDLKLAQYRDGASFCRRVIARVGVEGLNAVYESSGLLPTLEEIHAPDAWLARAFPGA